MATPAPLFTGHVTTSGKLELDNRPLFLLQVRAMAGQAVELVLRKKRTKRSLDQNAYIHAEPIPKLADKLGYTIPEMKLVLMGECFGWHEVNGHVLPRKPSTSDMDVEECKYFIDWVIPWAMNEHGVALRLPGEVEIAA